MHNRQSLLQPEDMVSIVSDLIADVNSEKIDELLDDDSDIQSLFSLTLQERDTKEQEVEEEEEREQKDLLVIEPLSLEDKNTESLFTPARGNAADPALKKKPKTLKRIYRKADYFIDKHFFPELLELDYGVKIEKKAKKLRSKPTEIMKQLYHKIDYKIDEKFFPGLLEVDYGESRDHAEDTEEIYENVPRPTDSTPTVIVTDCTDQGNKSDREGENSSESDNSSTSAADLYDTSPVKETQRQRMKRIISQRQSSGKPDLSNTVLRLLLGLVKYIETSIQLSRVKNTDYVQ